MRAKSIDVLTRTWQSEVNLSLFLALLIVVMFVLPSIGFEQDNLALYADVAFSIVLVFGAAIAWAHRGIFVLTSLVCAVAIVVRWANWLNSTNASMLWSASTGLAAVLAITAVLLWQVFSPGPVSRMRVQGAIAAYLCLGVGWAHAYHIVDLAVPGAFNTAGTNISGVASWANYSFGMLTTVGYDGIVPQRPLSHTLVSGEAITGQLYLAVLVARLVSMQVSASMQADKN